MKISTSYSLLVALGLAIGLAGCNSAMQVYKKGVRQFEQGEYNLAIESLQKAANGKGVTDVARLNYLLAESYRLSNRFPQAAPFYQKAIEAGIPEINAKMYYAYALKAQGRYPEALVQLDQYVATKPSSKVNLEKARREAETLRAIDLISQKKIAFQPKNIGALNSPGSEYAPVVRGDELIFTSSRKEKVYKNNGQSMTGIYKIKLAQKPDETGNNPQKFSANIFKEDANEGTPAFSKDGKIMIFARGNNGKRKGGLDVDLYISRLADNTWSDPLRLPISDSTAWDGSPAFSADGKTLYFASNRAGTVGGIDLYRTNMDASGRFSRPVNMGRDINTPGDEMFPYVAEDGKLYFASDGHPGLGKLDIFVATRSQGIISVENLGVPVNSPADDFGLFLVEKDKGYFASNREGGKGDDDIYYFDDSESTTGKPPVATTPPSDANAPKLVRYFIAGTVSENASPQAPLDSAKVRIIEDGVETPIAEALTNRPGTFGKYPLKEGKDYTILVERPGYLTKREQFTMQGRSIPPIFLKKAETDTTFEVPILLDKVSLGKTFVLDNIYYDLNKYNIRPDAAEELNKLVTILKDNPTLKIELSSHTDARDTDAYNIRLSQNRAKAAVEYIVSKGIASERMIAKGYGETQLIVKNAKTEDEHQRNRRTEFKILSF
jgi:peptidoglycan-associated lipoprotein